MTDERHLSIPKLIAICANGRRAGKDAAADAIESYCEKHDLSVERLAFALPGKQLIAKALGMRGPEQVDSLKAGDRLVGVLSINDEHKLDLVGTASSGREYIVRFMEGAKEIWGDEVWVDAVLPRRWHPNADITIVSDLRFVVEYERVRAHGGVLLRIERPDAEGGQAEGQLTQIWEHEREPTDCAIVNDRGLQDLNLAVFNFMDNLLYAH